MTIPPGVSAEAFKKALQDFANVVGREWVFYTDEDVARYSDSFSPFVAEPEQQRVASAAVAPTEVGQVQQIVRIANQYRIPLYAVSTGRNLGYGRSAPSLSGSVIVDLKRMNRIIEVNDEPHHRSQHARGLHDRGARRQLPRIAALPQRTPDRLGTVRTGSRLG